MSTEQTKTLAAALVALQAQMPRITKGETATVVSQKGSYKYSYAGLDTVSDRLLPVMTEVGLAFTSRPTLHDGTFGLAYSLMHTSGEREDGFYPLPSGGTPQAIGSAITYARRYCLLAVTGAAPEDEDDDAQAAMKTRSGAAGLSAEEQKFVAEVTEKVAAADTPEQLNKLWAQVSAASDQGLNAKSADGLKAQMKRRAQQLEPATTAA